MKKLVLFLVFLLVLNIFVISLNSLSSVKAQLEGTGLPSDLGGDVEKIQNYSEKGQETAEKLKDKEAREYLFQEWKKMLLGNKYISAIDSFLTRISPAFLVLFGEPYSLSGIFLIIVLLWFYFFFKFSEILKDFSPFSEGISWIIGLGLTIVMAQTQVLRKITEGLMWLVFYKEGNWYRFFIIVGIIVALFLIYYFTSAFGKTFKEQKKKAKEEIREKKLDVTEEIADEMIKGAAEKS